MHSQASDSHLCGSCFGILSALPPGLHSRWPACRAQVRTKIKNRTKGQTPIGSGNLTCLGYKKNAASFRCDPKLIARWFQAFASVRA